jgi:hypothetical protein
MFVQMIEGPVGDSAALRRQLGTWVDELAPGATGWLGTTAGITADGTFVALARFESAEAAHANSERPEQGAWWEQTSGTFEGDATFLDLPDVDVFGGGGSDDAGFVQIIQGKADREAVTGATAGADDILARIRPDVLGGFIAWPGDGTFTQVVYFSSEAEARKNEGAELSGEEAELMGRLTGALQAERFVDVPEPLLYSA